MPSLDLHPFKDFIASVRLQLQDEAFRAAFATLAALMLVGTLFYTFVEGWSLLDSLYFSVIAASTVGFGDFAPQTELGKAFTIVYVLTSVGLLVLILSRVARGMIDRRVAELDDKPDRPHRLRRRRQSDEAAAADDIDDQPPR